MLYVPMRQQCILTRMLIYAAGQLLRQDYRPMCGAVHEKSAWK